jgi:hypothetical protein
MIAAVLGLDEDDDADVPAAMELAGAGGRNRSVA